MTAKQVRKLTGMPRATRVSVSLPPNLFQKLQDIAKQKKVSVAWVTRDAAEKYIAKR
jgi:metal-responsive CopG/Arc/MetJ family transcriptional regulator